MAFEQALRGELENLQAWTRQALTEAQVQKPGPTAIAKRLGLDKSLAWKLGRIASASDPLQAFEFVPGSGGCKLITDALALSTVDPRTRHEVDRAFDQLAQVVRLHAGDRSTARAMTRALLSSKRPDIDGAFRREHFRTTSEIWGARAHVQVKADFFAPGLHRGQIDMAAVEGLVDLLRLRSDVGWSVGAKRVTKSANLYPTVFRPLQAQTGTPMGPPVLKEFCSDPLPEIESFKDTEGFTHFELSPSLVGRTGAVTCLIGTCCKNVIELDAPPKDNNLVAVADLRTPVELLVFDLFIHKSIVKRGPIQAELLGQLKKANSFPRSGMGQVLPFAVRAEPLGVLSGEQTLEEIPNYDAIVSEAFCLAGESLRQKHWAREDFMGLRMKLVYPPIPTVAVVRVPLQAPG